MDELKGALGDVWGNLGKVVSNDSQIEEMRELLNAIHAELLGTTEALEKRVVALEYENKVLREKLEGVSAQHNSDRVTNVFDLMSPEELLGRPLKAPQYDDGKGEEVEIRSVKGFSAPPPEIEIPEDEPIEIDLDEETVDFTTEEDDPLGGWVEKIYAHIMESDGVMNYRMKALELLPVDVTKNQKKSIYAGLERLGVKRYKVNKMYEFFYLGEGEGKELYEKFQKN